MGPNLSYFKQSDLIADGKTNDELDYRNVECMILTTPSFKRGTN